MATEARFYAIALAIEPHEVAHPSAKDSDVFSGALLFNRIRVQTERALTWEEWMDVRRAWADAHDCHIATQAGSEDLGAALAEAWRLGRSRVLLERV